MTNKQYPEDILAYPEVRHLLVSRRRVLAAGGAAALMPLSGCFLLFGLLRVGLRGRLISRGFRASRRSRDGQSLTLGRLASGAYQLYRLNNMANRISSLQQLARVEATEDGDVASAVTPSPGQSRSIDTVVDNAAICITEVEGRFFTHNSAYWGGFMGRTIADGDNLIHRSAENREIGFDKYEANRILHFDADRNPIGTTPFVERRQGDDTFVETTDDSYLRQELERIQQDISPRERAIMDYYAQAQSAQQACLVGRDVDCATLSARASSALKAAEERFGRKS